MSVQITVTIPLDIASTIRDINYDLELVDGDVEFTLAQITNKIIEAVKGLPQDSIPPPFSRFSSTSQDTARTSSSSRTASSSDWLGTRSCSGISTTSTDSAQSSMSSSLGLYMFPEFELQIENECGYNHRARATGDMTVADLEAMLAQVCGFESTWQSLTWHGYRVNQPLATLFMYGIDRYPFLEIKRRSPPGFDQQTFIALKEPLPPSREPSVPPGFNEQMIVPLRKPVPTSQLALVPPPLPPRQLEVEF